MAKAQNGKGSRKPSPKKKAPSGYGCCNEAIEVASDAADTIGESVGTTREAVRMRPLAACALSATAGALIGVLLLR